MPLLRILVIAGGLLILAALLWANRYGSLPDYRDERGRPVPGSISEVRQLDLGGYRQWITLRGARRDAPILIWLSGGPGLDESFMLRRFNGALERDYLVTYWVQRGAGRSSGAGLDPRTLTIGQFVTDLDDLVTYLTRRFGQRQVILVGHSWGTQIGVAYAAAHPERVAAYVGIGQVTDMPENEALGYAWVLSEARRRRDTDAIADLERIGPPPYPVAAMLTQRQYVAAYGGSFHQPISMPKMIWWSLETSRGAWLDLLKFSPGQAQSLQALWPEIARVRLSVSQPRLAVPVAIFAGRFDRQVSADLAHRYFTRLDAPRKQFVWFELSAHSPQFEEPDRFNATLVQVLHELRAPGGPD